MIKPIFIECSIFRTIGHAEIFLCTFNANDILFFYPCELKHARTNAPIKNVAIKMRGEKDLFHCDEIYGAFKKRLASIIACAGDMTENMTLEM